MNEYESDRDDRLEEFKRRMCEMTDEEFEERNKRVAHFIRYEMSHKERDRFRKKLKKSLKFLENFGDNEAKKEKKAAKQAKILTIKMIEEAKQASKL
jgi:hypothetical protein